MTQPPPNDRDPGNEPGRDGERPGGERRPGGEPGEPGEPGSSGGSPGEQGRDRRLAGFVRGGEWDRCAPGPELVAVLAQACGPEWRCPGAEPEELIGVLRRVAAVESWAAAAKLGVVRELIRQDDLPVPGRPRRGGMPRAWSDSLVHEIALALAVSAQSADTLMWAACELDSRLPGTGRLLADGTVTLPKARLIAETFQGLSDEDAARAEEQLLPQLAGPTGKTFTQVERLAAAIAASVDPDLAERQRKAAERERSRVQMFRERSGTAALSGRDLPTDETLAAYANVNARTDEYKDSGAFPGARMDQLRATAYLDLLNGVTADARIAHAIAEAESESGAGARAQAGAESGTGTQAGAASGADPRGQSDPGDWSGPDEGPSDCPCGECDGSCGDPGDGNPTNGGPGDGGTGDSGTGDSGTGDSGTGDDDPGHGSGDDGPGSNDPGDSCPDDDSPRDAGPGDSGPEAGGHGDCDYDPLGGGPDDPRPSGVSPGEQAPDLDPHPDLDQDLDLGLEPDQDPDSDLDLNLNPELDLNLDSELDQELVGRPAVADLVIPLLTLLGLAQRPGEGHGLGPLDPDLCRDLAATAARWPGSEWCVTVTDPDGIAIGHGCAKLARTGKPGRAAWINHGKPPHAPPVTSLAVLPARVNLTIPMSALEGLRALARPPPAPWAFTPCGDPGPDSRNSPDNPDNPNTGYGTWALRLPGGRDLTVTLGPVPVYSCDHRHESHAYKPNATLRHLVQVRDWECTFPSCSRHARASDFEHAVPYDKGGRTCACNAGARSRKCHRVKQSPGWSITQPRPGWHQWTTPAGWVYTQGPKRYPA
jgi:Domain of unknown function (DUF222)